MLSAYSSAVVAVPRIDGLKLAVTVQAPEPPSCDPGGTIPLPPSLDDAAASLEGGAMSPASESLSPAPDEDAASEEQAASATPSDVTAIQPATRNAFTPEERATPVPLSGSISNAKSGFFKGGS